MRTCQVGDNSCFPYPIRNRNGVPAVTASQATSWQSMSMLLNNGIAIRFDVNKGDFSMFVYTNGFKPPGKLGEEIFVWCVNKEGRIVPSTDPSLDQSNGHSNPEYNYAFRIMANGWKKDY
jgi:hypothetical protein